TTVVCLAHSDLLSPPPRFFLSRAPSTVPYPLSLHDALPISGPFPRSRRPGPGSTAGRWRGPCAGWGWACSGTGGARSGGSGRRRSEEHTSELQSRENLVCRLLLEKKKQEKIKRHVTKEDVRN